MNTCPGKAFSVMLVLSHLLTSFSQMHSFLGGHTISELIMSLSDLANISMNGLLLMHFVLEQTNGQSLYVPPKIVCPE